jgi:hypothetical protein
MLVKKIFTPEAIQRRKEYSLKYFIEPKNYILNSKKIIIPEIYHFVWEKYMLLSYYNEVYCQNDNCDRKLDYDNNFYCMTMNEDNKTFSIIESIENINFEKIYPICERCITRIYKQTNGLLTELTE